MNELPPCALEPVVNGEGVTVGYEPVEAPPCGERLDLDDRGVHLVCDRPLGHERDPFRMKHRQVLPTNYPVLWCDDGCAHRCPGPLSALARIRGHVD